MSKKNRDDKNRWRNVTIAFRMSQEENEELNNRVKLSGFRTKQDYIIQGVLHQKVVATGNPLMLVQFRKNLQQIERELERIERNTMQNRNARTGRLKAIMKRYPGVSRKNYFMR